MKPSGVSCWSMLLLLLSVQLAVAEDVPSTGSERPELAALDEWMKSFVVEHQIPGGALAIIKDGRLVYARGFGWADWEARAGVQPESLFRIASVSKPITPVAILKLAEAQRLKLTDKVLDYLPFDRHFEGGQVRANADSTRG